MDNHADREIATNTFLVTGGRPEREPDAPVNAPVAFTSTFSADGPVGYAREGNPTWAAYEAVLGGLDGGRALVFSSGMAAISTVFDTVPQGGLVIAPDVAYNGSINRLRALAELGRLRLQRLPLTDTAAWVAAVGDASLVWLEVPSNPLLEVPDLPTIISAAKAAGARVGVDSTLATPLNCRPLELGADYAVHSATKLLSGHSDVLLGVVTTNDEQLYAELQRRRTLLGGIAGPMEVFLGLRGVRTLAVRLDRVQSNARIIAERLQNHPAVTAVRYPGLDAPLPEWLGGAGGVLSFDVAGGAAVADAVCARTTLWLHSTSIGGVESQLERRRKYAAESAGVPTELIRLSVGIEDVEDLWRDLAQALEG